ncbi:MAG: Crp/Fnr family transcriptional regulator [Cyclobacteriaceae bacterium]
MEELLSKIGNFSKEEIDALNSVAKAMSLPKNTVFFKGESVFNRLYFLQGGIVRSYRLIDGKDFTYYFFFQNEFVVDFESFLTDEKSPFFFETLEDSTAFCFEKKDIYKLYNLYPKFEKQIFAVIGKESLTTSESPTTLYRFLFRCESPKSE